MKSALVFLALISLVFISSPVISHSGRTDKFGGHRDRKHGGYHYHNAGYAHARGNPYQNHKTCGVCTPPKNSSNKQPQSAAKSQPTEISVEELIMALEAGLKCMGYEVDTPDGKLDKKTRAAVKKFRYNVSQKGGQAN